MGTKDTDFISAGRFVYSFIYLFIYTHCIAFISIFLHRDPDCSPERQVVPPITAIMLTREVACLSCLPALKVWQCTTPPDKAFM